MLLDSLGSLINQNFVVSNAKIRGGKQTGFSRQKRGYALLTLSTMMLNSIKSFDKLAFRPSRTGGQFHICSAQIRLEIGQ